MVRVPAAPTSGPLRWVERSVLLVREAILAVLTLEVISCAIVPAEHFRRRMLQAFYGGNERDIKQPIRAHTVFDG